MANYTKTIDSTRLISAVIEVSNVDNDSNVFTINDPFAADVDVLSFNQYIGWYNGLPEKCKKVQWKIYQNKPVLISEFGAGAKYGYHGDTLT